MDGRSVPDVLPPPADVLLAGDLGIRKAAQLAYRLDELPRPKALEEIAAPWRPYRTRGCVYLWASLTGSR